MSINECPILFQKRLFFVQHLFHIKFLTNELFYKNSCLVLKNSVIKQNNWHQKIQTIISNVIEYNYFSCVVLVLWLKIKSKLGNCYFILEWVIFQIQVTYIHTNTCWLFLLGRNLDVSKSILSTFLALWSIIDMVKSRC